MVTGRHTGLLLAGLGEGHEVTARPVRTALATGFDSAHHPLPPALQGPKVARWASPSTSLPACLPLRRDPRVGRSTAGIKQVLADNRPDVLQGLESCSSQTKVGVTSPTQLATHHPHQGRGLAEAALASRLHAAQSGRRPPGG